MGEGKEEPSPPRPGPPTPALLALLLTQALSQAVAVSEDTQEVFEAYGSITWEERERRGGAIGACPPVEGLPAVLGIRMSSPASGQVFSEVE